MHLRDSNRPGIRPRFRLFVGAVLAATLLVALPAAAADIDKQRELFKSVYETVERGDWSPVDGLSAADRQLLQQYVLWPDLRATWLRANLGSVPTAEVDAFLRRYGTLRPVRELRYRQALFFAKNGDLLSYQKIYEQFYQGKNIARLDCLSLQAEISAGRYQRVDQRAIDLWLVGASQVDECDPVFAYLGDSNLLGPGEYRRRFDLAITAREFQLARWLAKSIDQPHVDEATLWISAQSDPEGFLSQHKPALDSDTYRQQLAYATERLTYGDPEIALHLWTDVAKQYAFSEDLQRDTERHIALWMARDGLQGGYALLTGLPQAAQDKEVVRWRARTSLRDNEWLRLLTDIAAMTVDDRDTEEWLYWRAVALNRLGQAQAARQGFESLSEERSYYGFLAADELGRDYALDDDRLSAAEPALQQIAGTPAIVRARELFLVGLEGRGRSEWDAAIRSFSPDEKMMAAVLADRWGWHSRAIATAASLGEYDDLEIRYPLPWQQQFESSSSAANISPTWAYGIARSESLFMRDVRSSAGAIGLMQLMPATGRKVAKNISLPYSGIATLTDPEANIRLGTSYLGEMAERFGGNPVLATAAYNAGPHRVDRWLPESGSQDARIWIENIPFNETRTYVKRVLSAQAIFHWRMTGQVRRVSDHLTRVTASDPTLASR
ncbi:MAG: transglycosylase SLT domain-containing protein [Gammaproteobacteria bacterium]|nr:transglycosylase SLT domain-containing protein [Gammaproteobacteria bacterium]